MRKSPSRPNLRQLASTLGLSVTTVSRALKNGPEVNSKTVKRVQEAAKTMGYVPNRTGQALRTGRTNVLAAILPLETQAYLSDVARLPLIEGMTVAAQARGYTLSIHSALPDADPLEVVQKTVGLGACDGLIITRMERNDTRIAWLDEQGIPFVTFGRSDSARQHAYVDIDNAKIAQIATAQLLSEGHRRIALQVLGGRDMASAERISGFFLSHKEAGIHADPALVGTDHFDMETSSNALDHLLLLPDPPTAMICVSELGLLGAIAALRRHGISAPSDFALITRDNTRMCDFLGLPGIRYHSVDMARVGQSLVEGLLGRIDHPDDGPFQKVFAPGPLFGDPPHAGRDSRAGKKP
ncbi:transcriptional regulator (plasmid) [Sagittula sp. P11]|uniref:LacI family DNA-binding transcriptional regulator n=1 Tax=Sagittula sp. P11 TaxID=2009329 RepID=UPI000C2D40EA|nr:LacI family DNA-binding transcriptional regulator [Sagittula sp. P11]AUC56053.1 transcriptional regulator [Sagittula sp. P11]